MGLDERPAWVVARSDEAPTREKATSASDRRFIGSTLIREECTYTRTPQLFRLTAEKTVQSTKARKDVLRASACWI
jgi:hypothetical protein